MKKLKMRHPLPRLPRRRKPRRAAAAPSPGGASPHPPPSAAASRAAPSATPAPFEATYAYGDGLAAVGVAHLSPRERMWYDKERASLAPRAAGVDARHPSPTGPSSGPRRVADTERRDRDSPGGASDTDSRTTAPKEVCFLAFDPSSRVRTDDVPGDDGRTDLHSLPSSGDTSKFDEAALSEGGATAGDASRSSSSYVFELADDGGDDARRRRAYQLGVGRHAAATTLRKGRVRTTLSHEGGRRRPPQGG